MKPTSLFSAIFLVFFFSCGPARQVAPDAAVQDIKIRIEFRDDNTTRQRILQTLRPVRPVDVSTTGAGDIFETEAVFTKVSRVEFERIQRIEQQLKLIPGVLDVEVKRPSRPVMQTGYIAP
jgi:hypothetical protein